MNLKDVYDQLHYGELKHVFLAHGSSDEEGTDRANYRDLLPHVLLGLTALHTRFLLREGSFNIELVEGQASYFLLDQFAQSNTRSREQVKYIDDSAVKFENNLLKVERIYGTYCGREYEIPLNDLGRSDSIRTPAFNSILVPTDTQKAPWLAETDTLRVVYRADHPAIENVRANASARSVQIHLQPSYLEALLLFMASRVHTPMGLSDEFHDGNNYATKYEAKVQELLANNMAVDSDDSTSRLEEEGWP